MPAVRKQKSRKSSEIQYPPLKLDFVRVGGRYRVGKLLGSGRSGECGFEMSWKQSHELSSERLFGERYRYRI
jgi:hypothetical protein